MAASLIKHLGASPTSLIDAIPAGCIIAGGKAQRFGSDKATADLNGIPLYSHALNRIAPQVGQLAINAPADAAWVPAALPHVIDDAPDAGPMAGLAAGLKWARQAGFRWLLTTPVDCPFLPTNLALRLMQEKDPAAQAAIAEAGRPHFLIGVWHTDLQPKPEGSLKGFLASVPHSRIRFDDEAKFMNINTIEELKKAEGLSI